VELAERFADGFATRDELEARDPRPNQHAAYFTLDSSASDAAIYASITAANEAVSRMARSARASGTVGTRSLTFSMPVFNAERMVQANLLRDIFGNPFRTVANDRNWLTLTVKQLSAVIYADRAFERLPLLADALEDAGCTDATLLEHCRGPGPHVRGCWVVDLLLGKE
jgi:hypothetical protein